jgi:carbon-monoxide dehydrogenase medium subunit
VKPPPFAYERAESVEHAAALLAEHGDEAKILAGGQSLVPILNFRLIRPSMLIDVNSIEGLAQVDGRSVGATVRQADFSGVPLADLALPNVGHLTTRNRGTVGGSVAHADPSAELPLCLLVLGGAVRTSRGREIQADDFFVSHFTTTLEPDELVTATLWPEGAAVGFAEVGLRHGDYALSMCACSVRVDGGEVTEARVGVGSVVDRPTLLDVDMSGAEASRETARAVGAAAAGLVDPPANLHASAEYLKHLTAVVVERALTQAIAA